jgi:hypothetical protein
VLEPELEAEDAGGDRRWQMTEGCGYREIGANIG